MSIEFDKKKGREEYLQVKLDDLLAGINESYGQSLLDELMTRLESTIKDFNDEVKGLLAALKENSEKKDQLLEKIKNSPEPVSENKNQVIDTDNPPQELSLYEKRLEGIIKD